MEQVKRILIIHQGALGDFILSLPAISAFRYHYPDASIEIWGHLEILRSVDKSVYADTIYSIDRERIASLFTHDNLVPASVIERFSYFDLIFIFGGEKQTTFVHNLKKRGIRTVYRIDPFPPDGSNTHVIDHQASQLSPLGLKVPLSTPTLFPPEEDGKRIAFFLEQRKIDREALVVALHPGSGSSAKVWSSGNCAQLSKQLLGDDRVHLIVPIGPADKEHAEDYGNLISSERIIPVSNLSLNELAATLKRCMVYVGNDSGVTHMAAAVGTPVVALFGPTDPQVWGPRGKHVHTVYRGVSCSPCSREEMNACSHKKCLESITVEDVYRSVSTVIQHA
jgi:ADP-heptose:LPS heptosyltransferase